MNYQGKNYWAIILGGSSGFGLASAKKLASCGMNICIVHRDRKGSMERIEKEFDEIRKHPVHFLTYNLDALSKEGRATVLAGVREKMGEGKVRLLLHSIAFGSLKLIAPLAQRTEALPATLLAQKLGLEPEKVQSAVDALFESDAAAFASLATPPKYGDIPMDDEELSMTIYAMGTSIISWTRDIHAEGMFASDARVIGLTSEGNEIAWLGYAAVSAAKVALEAASRSIAKEFGPYGIRSNIVQPGVTDTPALRLIPGNPQLKAHARLKNPFGRLTTVEDVANVVSLLSSDEAAWINGALIRADGGECIAG